MPSPAVANVSKLRQVAMQTDFRGSVTARGHQIRGGKKKSEHVISEYFEKNLNE